MHKSRPTWFEVSFRPLLWFSATLLSLAVAVGDRFEAISSGLSVASLLLLGLGAFLSIWTDSRREAVAFLTSMILLGTVGSVLKFAGVSIEACAILGTLAALTFFEGLSEIVTFKKPNDS